VRNQKHGSEETSQNMRREREAVELNRKK